jgi:hypothetical protein
VRRVTTQPLASRALPDAPRAPLVGWPLVGWCTVAILVLEAAILAVAGTGEGGLRMVVRASARTSVVLFCAAFGASAWFRLRRDRIGRFLLLNRRYLGVSFAVSHLSHLVAIVALARTAPDFHFATPTVVVGGLGYVFVAAMAATSFDRAAAWLGPARWRRLHLVGGWYVWLVFVVSYVPRAVSDPTALSVAAAALLLATAGARFAARRRTA